MPITGINANNRTITLKQSVVYADVPSHPHHFSDLGSATGVVIQNVYNNLKAAITAINGNTITIDSPAINTDLTHGAMTIYHNDQPAFVAARAAAQSGGGYVYAPTGTYYLGDDTSSVDMADVSLSGDGRGKTIIRGMAKIPTLLYWHKTGGINNLLINGVTIDAQDYPFSGYDKNIMIVIGEYTSFDYNSNVSITQSEFINASNILVDILNPINLRVDNNRFHNAQGGITFHQTDDLVNSGSSAHLWVNNPTQYPFINCYNIWVTNNEISQIAWLGGMDYGLGANPTIVPNGGSYATGRYRNVHVDYNTFYDIYLTAWEFYANSIDSEATGNVSNSCGYNSSFGDYLGHGAMTVKYSQNVQLIGNQAHDCFSGTDLWGTPDVITQYGVGPDKNITITNGIYQNNIYGIYLGDDFDGVNITNNLIDGATADNPLTSGAGIYASTDPGSAQYHLLVTNNTIQSGQFGARINENLQDVSFVGNSFISNNAFESDSSSTSGIALHPYGSSSFDVSGVTINQNSFLEYRKSPAYPQAYPIYANNMAPATISMTGNVATGNGVNTYSLGSNATGAIAMSYGNTWDSGGLAAPPVASTTVSGTSKVDGTTITINNGVISAINPIASTTVSGTSKVDGSTIAINNGVISAVAPPIASTTVSGTVKVDGTSIKINNGVIAATTQLDMNNPPAIGGTTPNAGTFSTLNVSPTSGIALLNVREGTGQGANPSFQVLANDGSTVRLKTTNTYTQFGGSLGIGANPGACTSSLRGHIRYTAGATDVADTVEICAKSSTNDYAWRVLIFSP